MPTKPKENTMLNLSNQTERHDAIHGPYPIGGIAPLRQDLARHAYLEKKLVHAEMDKHQPALALQAALAKLIKRLIRVGDTAVQPSFQKSGANVLAILTFRWSTDCRSAIHRAQDSRHELDSLLRQ
jgi:hypothetical protein